MQSSQTEPEKKKRYAWNTLGNIFVILMFSIFFLVLLAIILIQTAPVQNFARGKIQTYLSKKLNTKVEIGAINIHFPNSVLLKNIYLEDQSKDTLISGGQLQVDINMWRLFKNEVQIKNIDLDNITLKIKRLQPDTVFNFQFIADAFMGKSPAVKNDTTAALRMNIDNIIITRTRIIYRDTITGNDMDIYLKHFDTKISTFDPSHMYFDVPTIALNGLRGYFYQNEPLKQKIIEAVAAVAQQPNTFLRFKNSKISLTDIDFAYKSEPSKVATTVVIGSLEAHPDTIDVKGGKFDFKDVTMNNGTIAVTMSAVKAPPVTQAEQAAINSLPSFTLKSDNLKITQSNFKLNDVSAPVLKHGMDYSHLDIKALNLDAGNLYFNVDTIGTSIRSGSLTEKSGFILSSLTGDLLYTPTGTSVTNLFLKTPGTTLRRSFAINYKSLDAISKNTGQMGLDINLENSSLQVKDLLTFVPTLSALPAFSKPSEIWMIYGHLTGRVDNMRFDNLKIKGHETTLYATGTINGLPDTKKFMADLDISYFNSTRRDIESFVPKGTLPASFKLPEMLSASGKVKVSMSDLITNLTIKTNVGSATLNGYVKNFTDSKRANYDMAVSANSLNLGEIMGQPTQLGLVSTKIKIKGSGFDPKFANAKFNGIITSAEIKKYTYRNVKLNGSIGNQMYNATGSIHDPNANLSFTANGTLNGKYPSIHLSAQVDSIKTFALHLTPQPLTFHGQIAADFTNLDPDNLDGNLLLTHSIIVNSGQRMQFDSLQLLAANEGTAHRLEIKSDFLSLSLKGQYKLTQLANFFQQAIDPYFSISASKNVARNDPYNFTINGGIIENPALKAFFPSITRLKPVVLSGHFASDSGWSAFLAAPYTVYGGITLDDIKINAGTQNGMLNFNSSVVQVKSGSGIALYATSLDGSLQNNKLTFTLNTKDSKSVNKYTLSALLDQPTVNNYNFTLKPENLLLNYKKWSVNPNNSIQYFNKDVTATNFILSQGEQQLSLNSLGNGNNRPLSIDFKNFNLSTLTAFAQTDSLIVNGILNGNALVKNLQVQPTFTTDLTITDLSIYKDTLGILSAKINNPIANQYNANVSLTGRGNNVTLVGDYYVKPANNSSFNLTINLVTLQMASLEGFTKGSISNSRGNLTGRVELTGSISKPVIDGKIAFNNTAFVVTTLNSVFKIDKSAIAIISNKGVQLNQFTIRDTADNAVIIDGSVDTKDFMSYGFNLKINADNFQAINSTKKDNPLFYGKMVFSTALTIQGTPTNPVIDGSLTINDNTNFSVVLPQNEPGVVQREGIVRFVDYSKTAQDSLFMMAPYDSLHMSPFQGYNVSVNINVTRAATFNMIVDEGNGDFLKLRGDGQLTGGIDESGKITLVGSYEINEGSYDLSFNFIKRKFLIQKGSRIVWTGEPTTANIAVTAIYIANTPPLDLVQGQTEGDPNIYKQKLPFEVHLGINGELLQPQIAFDIILPDEKNYSVSKDIITTVETKLNQLRQEPGELNKQVFALLLLNRFVGQNPFDNSSGGSLDANTFARQSVSRLLTEQLNKLTEGLIQGVDINLDLATTEDYTTGSKQNRTDFNVGLSKRLLNDRLTVTVGSNFELEGPRSTNQQQNNVAGNIAIDYKLSKNGRYLLRAYRKNDYQGAIEGYVIETGIGFIVSVDYNRLKELLEYRKSKKVVDKKIKQEDKEAASKIRQDVSSSKNTNDDAK